MTEFEQLYRKYANDVYRFAYWLSGDAHFAEELVSEAFLRLWGSREKVEIGTVKGYLLVIARNLFLNERKRRSRQHALPGDTLDTSQPVGERLEKQDSVNAAMHAIQSLPEMQRSCLLLRLQHGLGHEEIARALKISVTASKVNVSRARRKLNQLFKESE